LALPFACASGCRVHCHDHGRKVDGTRRRFDEQLGAAALERTDRVQVLDLEQQLAAEIGGERRAAQPKRLQKERIDIVCGGENSIDVERASHPGI
jgi:hypothetical protein